MSEPVESYLDAALGALHRGDLGSAEDGCRQALVLDLRNAGALHLLGVVARRQGRVGEAIALMREAVRLGPQQPEYASNLVALLSASGLTDDAVAVAAETMGRHPDFVYLPLNLGVALHALGREDEAAAAFGRAVALAPDLAPAHFGLGCALDALGRHAEAEAALRRTEALAPDHAEAQNLLGRVLTALGRHAEACEAFRRAVRSDPRHAVALNNLGSVLVKLDRTEEALDALTASLALNGESAQTHYNMSVVLQEFMRIPEAIAHVQRAISLESGHVDAHWCLALQLLQSRRWAEGWRDYEWRWQLAGHSLPPGPPPWSGQPLARQALLVRSEQGQGDTLQFLRYLEPLRRLCPDLRVMVQRSLVRLVAGNFPGLSVTAVDDPAPAADFQVPLMSLPLLLGEEDPDPAPYLAAEAGRVDRWTRFWAGDASSPRRVGIAWRGSPTYKRDAKRSVSLEALAPLTGLSGVRFCALHPDLREEERPVMDRLGIEDVSAQISDFADTAALLRTLDLVISVDTSVVHLAGALGCPVWVMLPFSCDWRWGTDQPDSVWYQGVRLFRQDRPGDWPGVIARVAGALRG